MSVSRRGFLMGLGALVGGVAIEQAIPLGRVWSFPTQVKPQNLLTPDVVTDMSLKALGDMFRVGDMISIAGDSRIYQVKSVVGSTINLRMPLKYVSA